MEDIQPQPHQQATVPSPDEIVSMQINQEAIQQVPSMLPPGQMYPYPAAYPAAQSFQMLYSADPSAIYPGGYIPEQQYAYCYYPAAAYQPMQTCMQQQQQQQQHAGVNTKASTNGAPPSQQGPYPVATLPPSPVSGYPNFQAYGPVSMATQPPHLMPYYCCPQASLQYQHQIQHQYNVSQQMSQDCRMQQHQPVPTIEASYTDHHNGQVSPRQLQSYTELYHQQQQQTDTSRPEANFEVGYQQDEQQPIQIPRYQNIREHQHLVPMNRRRNGYMHNILYKTELCRDVQEKGTCPRGKTCQFAHTHAELHDPRKHPLYKTAFCFDYKNRGFCPRGPHCFHVHDISELKTPPPFIPQQQQPPQQLMPSSTPSATRNTSNSMPTQRLPRSGRMRRRVQRQPPQQQQLLDEAPGPSHDRRATPKEQPHVSVQQSAAAADTPFNFLMKKLQQQHQEKSVELAAAGGTDAAAGGELRAVEDKTRMLRLSDAWSLEPVRAAQ